MRWFAILSLAVLSLSGCSKKSSPTEPQVTPLPLNSGELVITFVDGSSGGVMKVNPSTGAQAIIASGGDFVDPSGVAFASNGDLYVADEDAFGTDVDPNGGALFRISRATGARTTIFRDGTLYSPLALAVSPSGDIFFTCYVDPSGTAIVKLNPTTGTHSVVASRTDNTFGSYGIALTSGDILVAANADGGAGGGVLRVNGTSGAVDTVSWGDSLRAPITLAVDGSGNSVVTDANDPNDYNMPRRVFRVSAVGTQTLLSSGGNLADPSGITVRANGDIFVYDEGNHSDMPGHVIRLDPASGAQSVVASVGMNTSPSGIAIVP